MFKPRFLKQSSLHHGAAIAGVETDKRPMRHLALAHLGRWTEKGAARDHFVEWIDKPVSSVKTAFKTAVRLAKLDGRISSIRYDRGGDNERPPPPRIGQL
jgi:hypothetical protein